MTDEHNTAASGPDTGQPEPDRYYAELVSTGTENFSMAALQEAMNTGTRRSWKLISVVNAPAGVVLIWDQSGFISG